MPISRREFAKASLGLGTLLATGSEALLASEDRLIHKTIPSSGEQIPVIGVGTNRYGVGDSDQLRAPLRESLKKFHELGGTVIDTAPGYRTSETVLGDLIAELGIRGDLFVATKVDREGRSDSDQRMRASFGKLRTETVDLMQVHNFRGWQDSIPLMRELKQEGRIRYTGITTSRERQYELMEKVMKQEDLDFIQINYSLAQQEAADRILPLARDRGMAVLINRPFGAGRLFGALADRSFPVWAAEFDCESWAQFLLKYVLSHPATTCVIPGMTKVNHVVDNFGAARGRLPDATERKQQETFFANL